MPRYHYSRIAPTSSHTPSPDSFLPRHPLTPTPTTTTSNTNPSNSLNYASFKSTFIPLVTTTRANSSHKRESIPIPITREDGSTQNNENSLRTVPITFVSSNTNNSKPQFTSFLRPTSKYFQHQTTNSTNNLSVDEIFNSNGTAVPRLPLVSRRLSLTSPIVLPNSSSISSSTPVEDETTAKTPAVSSPSARPIPIRFPHSSMLNNHSRTTSAILRSVPKSNVSQHSLQRQKTDLSLTGETQTNPNTNEILLTASQRRADMMAREAIQGVVRFQQQQQQQPHTSNNDSPIDLTNYNHISMRSPAALSRRVIINLKNNQSVSLDSRLLSANPITMKPPIIPSSARLAAHRPHSQLQQHVELQIPSHPAPLTVESPPLISSSLPNSFKNEFRMEIPVNVLPTSHELETNFHSVTNREDDDDDDENETTHQQTMLISERLISANPNSNQTLKSILKRSSSRENVARKNVSFMNA